VPGTIEQLPTKDLDGHEASNPLGADHPMRTMTRRAAGLQPPAWDAAARVEVAGLFNDLAPEWHTRDTGPRAAVVADALERGGVGDPAGVALELGSGIGTYTGMVGERFAGVLAAELSIEMSRLASGTPASRLLADGVELPLADASVDAVVLVNMLLFPAEVDRVLAPGGCVVWVNSSGESTPIHLPTEEVVAALPGEWKAVTARAGIGLWAVLRRA
jgi:SAM-dependent methyltransferase